jgi:hypothetical protein
MSDEEEYQRYVQIAYTILIIFRRKNSEKVFRLGLGEYVDVTS